MDEKSFACFVQSSEIEAFLRFLFQSIGYRPQRLALQETASVAAYLMKLSKTGLQRNADQPEAGNKLPPPKHDREPDSEEMKARSLALALAQTLWGSLLQFGNINPASRTAVRPFLERHRNTYLANHHFETIVALIEDFEIPPPKEGASSEWPVIQSAQMQVPADADSHFQNDLSERIFAAFWLLRRVRNRARVIADFLNLNSIDRPRRMEDEATCSDEEKSSDPAWDESAVTERAKMFERLNLKRSRNHGRKKVQEWRMEFRFAFTHKWYTNFCCHQLLNQDIERGVKTVEVPSIDVQ